MIFLKKIGQKYFKDFWKMLKNKKPFKSINELYIFDRLQNIARKKAFNGERKHFKFHKDQKKIIDF